MDKILLLDWDGPISNSRTWKMPGFVDPVAIQLLNDLTNAGWKTVFTSTKRKHYKDENDSVNRVKATSFMRDAGFNVQWYTEWRTDPDYTAMRHLEVATWLMHTEIPEDAIFLVVDDEHFPHELLERGRMVQIYADAHEGIGFLELSKAYKIIKMTDAELEEEFSPEEK